MHNIIQKWAEVDLEKGVAKFLAESNTLHIKSKAIKMLSCKNFATLLNPPLMRINLILFFFISFHSSAGWSRQEIFDREITSCHEYWTYWLTVVYLSISSVMLDVERIKEVPNWFLSIPWEIKVHLSLALCKKVWMSNFCALLVEIDYLKLTKFDWKFDHLLGIEIQMKSITFCCEIDEWWFYLICFHLHTHVTWLQIERLSKTLWTPYDAGTNNRELKL